MPTRDEVAALKALPVLVKRLDDIDSSLAIIAEELRRANRLKAFEIASGGVDEDMALQRAEQILDFAKGGR
jgi:hypothetical protein